MNEILLKVENLSISIAGKKQIELTRNVSFEISHGEIFALVGESGSGKTISSMAVMGIYPQPGGYKKSGHIFLGERDISSLSETEWQEVRGSEIAMIYQEPAAALNPLQKIRKQLEECFLLHGKKDCLAIEEVLLKVGFSEPERILNSYPHELSGGMQQRVMIAMALLNKPKLLIADEPTTALDVTIQAQILDLLIELQEEMGMSILFITHNLALVAQYADRLAVMKDGKIVEENSVVDFFENPTHEYSKELLDAIPGKRVLHD